MALSCFQALITGVMMSTPKSELEVLEVMTTSQAGGALRASISNNHFLQRDPDQFPTSPGHIQKCLDLGGEFRRTLIVQLTDHLFNMTPLLKYHAERPKQQGWVLDIMKREISRWFQVNIHDQRYTSPTHRAFECFYKEVSWLKKHNQLDLLDTKREIFRQFLMKCAEPNFTHETLDGYIHELTDQLYFSE